MFVSPIRSNRTSSNPAPRSDWIRTIDVRKSGGNAMTEWHIAQMNVGTTLFPTDDPRIAGFMEKLDEVNAVADSSPGFVWRLQTESGNATDIKPTDNPNFIVNMSVWSSVEALFEFVY